MPRPSASDNGLFQALFNTAPDAVIVIDREGRIVLANSQAERLFGYQPEELLGLAVEILMPARMRPDHGAHRAKFMSNPRSRPMGAGYELVGARKDGSEFPVEIALSPVHAGDEMLYSAAIRDISETQRARQALARGHYDKVVAEIGRLALESTDFDALLQALPPIIASALSIDAVAILISDAHRHMPLTKASFGLTVEILDRLPSLFENEGWHARILTSSSEVLLHPESRSADHELKAFANTFGYMDAIALALFDRYEADGVLLAFATEAFSFNHDKLHFLRSTAHKISAAMQRSRSEEQLAHAQRLDAIGQLTGGVAHDFNNLLTVISGNLQLLEDDDCAGEERTQIIQSARRAVGNGAALTRKLLAFARRQRLSPRAIELESWLADLTTLLKRTLGETIVIRTACAEAIDKIFADPSELDAALVNLALNARDAMPRGGELSIEVAEHEIAAKDFRELTGGQYISISVSDTGIGMAPDVLARVLEPFFTTKAAGKGSGLGLSMAYGFAKQSGGALVIESQLGYGTRVALYLPTAPEGEGTVAIRQAAPKVRGGETVLVVEDEPEVRGIAVAFLKSLGYASLIAVSAEDAMELLLRDASIDLVFSDVVLGGSMNGFDLAKEAQRMRPGLPVLLTSGYEHTDVESDKAGIGLDLLRKPYSRDEFSIAIRRALGVR